jgi:hypothetical protein
MKIELEPLIAWLESKPKDGTYRYSNGGNCLLAQYLKAQGADVSSVGPYGYSIRNKEGFNERFDMPDDIDDIAAGGPNDPDTMTYGEALHRAYHLREQRKRGI